MKYWIIFLSAFLAAAICGPGTRRGTDIAGLAPVEVVWLSQSDGQIFMETDLGDHGVGEDMRAVLEDIKGTASGVVLLDTADYLIVEKGCEELLEQTYALLRPSCKICTAKEIPDLEAAAEYLSAHEPAMTLRRYRVEKGTVPELTELEGRFALNAE